MKLKYTLLSAVIAFGLAGCSSAPDSDASDDKLAQAQNSVGYKCKKERTTGTIISKKRCTTAAQREAEREQAQEMLRNRKTNTGESVQ